MWRPCRCSRRGYSRTAACPASFDAAIVGERPDYRHTHQCRRLDDVVRVAPVHHLRIHFVRNRCRRSGSAHSRRLPRRAAPVPCPATRSRGQRATALSSAFRRGSREFVGGCVLYLFVQFIELVARRHIAGQVQEDRHRVGLRIAVDPLVARSGRRSGDSGDGFVEFLSFWSSPQVSLIPAVHSSMFAFQ